MNLSTIKLALTSGDGTIFDIGQIEKDGKNWLEKEVRKGNIKKSKALWPWITCGTCKKTLYQNINYGG